MSAHPRHAIMEAGPSPAFFPDRQRRPASVREPAPLSALHASAAGRATSVSTAARRMLPLSNELLDRLAGLQNPDGGWGAARSRASNAEATALAVLALSAGSAGAEVGDAVAAGARWLGAAQLRDGSVPFLAEVPDTSWTTGLGALALLPSNPDAADRAGHFLLAEKGRGFPWWMSAVYRLFPDIKDVETDLDLPGWPWNHGAASWVEPTAYALIALKTLAPGLGTRRVARRVDGAERMLLQRTCPDGGWNYGNGSVLGEALWAFPDTTALALLALRDRHPLPETVAGLTALERSAVDDASALCHALAALCARAYDRDPAPHLDRFEAAYRADGARGETRVLALGVLASSPTPQLTVPAHGP